MIERIFRNHVLQNLENVLVKLSLMIYLEQLNIQVRISILSVKSTRIYRIFYILRLNLNWCKFYQLLYFLFKLYFLSVNL